MDYKMEEKSLWDKNGGYMFRKGSSRTKLILHLAYKTILSDGILKIYLKQE